MKENELMELVEQTSVLMERYQHNTDKVTQNNANILQNLQHLTQVGSPPIFNNTSKKNQKIENIVKT